MAALSPAELFKKRTECRRNIFITKFEKEQPFKMEKGVKDVIFDKHDKNNIIIIKILRTAETSGQLNGKKLNGWTIDVKKRTAENKMEFSFSAITKTAEFGGGGRGAPGSMSAADATRLGESAAAVFAQAKFVNYRSKFSKEDIHHAYSLADVDEKIDNIQDKLTENWFLSTRLTADKIKDTFKGVPGTPQFHRGGKLVQHIENKFKKLNSKEKKFSNVNKWTPADIWLSSKQKQTEIMRLISDANSLFELNQVLRQLLNSQELVGISLKMVATLPTAKYINYDRLVKKQKLKFKSHIIGSTDYFSSMDAYAVYTEPNGKEGKIQFRTWAETFQGEIKGATANHGKISYGPMVIIMKDLNIGNQGAIYKNSASDVRDLKIKLKENNEEVYQTFYNNYVSINKDTGNPLSFEEFKLKIKDKKNDWKFSKYMSSALLNTLITSGKFDAFISKCISYASSESELSAPFVKIS